MGSCKYCRFAKAYNEYSVMCRRFPPSVNIHPGSVSHHPIVSNIDWCGEFVKAEEKD